jgi:hypothetical protein
MTTLRSRIFIMISVVILLILGISVGLTVLFKKKAPATEQTPTTTPNTIDTQNFPAQITTPATKVPEGLPVKQATTEEVQKNIAKQMARIFIERYATFSSDNNGDNIREVESIVTKELWAEISKRLNVAPTGVFSGATTKVFAIDVTEFASGQAKVVMMTQRTITKGTTTEQKNENVNVWLVKSGDTWLVEKFEWVK